MYRFAGFGPFERSTYFGPFFDLGQFERFRWIFIQLGRFDMFKKKMRENLILGHSLKDYKEYLLFCYIWDIKGANLLVDASGVVKLADFGVAKHVSLMVFGLLTYGVWAVPLLKC